MMKKILSHTWLVLVALFMYVPVLILAFYSFTESTAIGAVRGFSLQNYVTLFTMEELRDMIVGTLTLAVGAAGIASVLGTLGAVGAFYSRPSTRAALETANRIPVVNADVVTAFSICIMLIIVFGIDKDTFVPLVIGHSVLCTPFVYLAIVSGFMLSITLSLDDYFISTYTKPATFDTISTYVVNATRGSQTEIKTALWALSTVIFVIVILAVVIMNAASAGSGKKQEVSAHGGR